MLRSINEIKGYSLSALDGEIGNCKDFLIDDKLWTIRYMVADTGNWLPGRKVLIPPFMLGKPEWASRKLPVRMTKEEIETAPELDNAAPVSRLYEKSYFKHFGWPYYAAGMYPGGSFVPAYMHQIMAGNDFSEEEIEQTSLRSARELTGYHIDTMDGRVGHVEDFILDDNAWLIRYMVIDTRDWLPCRKVLVSPEWIDQIDWANRKVYFELLRDTIKNSPPYDPSKPINSSYEMRLYDYYGRPLTWEKDLA